MIPSAIQPLTFRIWVVFESFVIDIFILYKNCHLKIWPHSRGYWMFISAKLSVSKMQILCIRHESKIDFFFQIQNMFVENCNYNRIMICIECQSIDCVCYIVNGTFQRFTGEYFGERKQIAISINDHVHSLKC